MKLTSNYNLKKPDGSDVVNIQDINDTVEKIDEELKKINVKADDMSFATATDRANIENGDSRKVVLGKISKWFQDLKGLAFKDKVEVGDLDSSVIAHNLTTTDVGKVLGADQGGVLQGRIAELNDNLMPLLKNVRGYENFTQKISDMISGDNFISTSVVVSGDMPEYAPVQESSVWYNVLTVGIGNRCYQTAVQCFEGAYHTGKMYIRTQHDDNVSDWHLMSNDFTTLDIGQYLVNGWVNAWADEPLLLLTAPNFNKIIGVIKNPKSWNTEQEILRIPNYYSEHSRVFQSSVFSTQHILYGVVNGNGSVWLKCNMDNYVAESYIILDITFYK